jgi:hypothetical protein
MPIITGIYTLISDFQNIVIFQYFFYSLSVTLFLVSFFLFFGSKLSSLLGTIAISYFSTSTVIIEHNYKLTSEGLNNSSLILFLASLLLTFKYRNIFTFTILLLTLILLGGTKAVTALVSLIFLPVLIFKFRKLLFEKKLNAILVTAISVPVIYLFVATFSSDYSKNYTTSSIINERLWLDENWKNEVLNSGYPISARQTWEAFSSQNLGLPPDNAVINNENFQNWYKNQGGKNFLLLFMVKNLDYTIFGPFCLPCFSEGYTFKQTVLSGWTQGTDEIKNNIELNSLPENRTILWPNEPEKAYSWLAVTFVFIAMLFIVSALSKREIVSDLNFFVLVSFAYGLVYSLISWYFGSKANDMNRHQLLMSIDLRIILIFSVVSILVTLKKFAKKSEVDV